MTLRRATRVAPLRTVRTRSTRFRAFSFYCTRPNRALNNLRSIISYAFVEFRSASDALASFRDMYVFLQYVLGLRGFIKIPYIKAWPLF